MRESYPLKNAYRDNRGMCNVFYSEEDAKGYYKASLENGASEDRLELKGDTVTILSFIKGK